ncbi:MAG: 50S ribosomal protein L4 [Planctomycetes bacterium]|nr:50S ribosomal protein L4 [Planctomycetota bacterium]
MAKVPLYNASGVFLRTVEVTLDGIASAVRPEMIRRAVVAYEANRRQGNADTKERGEVAGSHRKPWRQKGTGRARAGHRRSPLWRGGGTIFGPTPRDYRHHLPERAKRGACASALRAKVEDGELAFIEEFRVDPAKTRTVVRLLKAIGDPGSWLLGTESADPLLWRCSRNLPRVGVLPVDQINAEHLVRGGKVLVTEAGFRKLVGRVTRDAAAEVKP